MFSHVNNKNVKTLNLENITGEEQEKIKMKQPEI